MNTKDYTLSRLIDIVVDCSRSAIWDDNTITRNTLLGNSKNENACMARAILVCQLIDAGYTITTIAKLLKRTAQGIRHIVKTNYSLLKSSRAYRIVSNEVAEKCKELLEVSCKYVASKLQVIAIVPFSPPHDFSVPLHQVPIVGRNSFIKLYIYGRNRENLL